MSEFRPNPQYSMPLDDYRKLVDELNAAREREAELQEEIERLKERPVCDCHAWPTAKELHDYTLAVESKDEWLDKENAKLRELVNTLNKALDESKTHSEKLRGAVERLRNSLWDCHQKHHTLKCEVCKTLAECGALSDGTEPICEQSEPSAEALGEPFNVKIKIDPNMKPGEWRLEGKPGEGGDE